MEDDSKTPSGDKNKDVAKFVVSWATNPDAEVKGSSAYSGFCSQTDFAAMAKNLSQILKADMFAACNSIVTADKYMSQLEHDVCRCGLDHRLSDACECSAIATYARACALNGYVVEWRSEELCGECIHVKCTASFKTV